MRFATSAVALHGQAPISAAMAPPRRSLDASTLTERLDAKLMELEGRGFDVRWIEASDKCLVTLFQEGGDDAIVMDPDPAADRAWYGDFEVRPTEKDCVWIFIEGEVPGEISAHVIS